jgi:hypothetical protein
VDQTSNGRSKHLKDFKNCNAIFYAAFYKIIPNSQLTLLGRAQLDPMTNEFTASVARFFIVQHTKTGGKYTKRTQNIPSNHKIYQMARKCTNTFHFKTIQNLPKFGILV